MTISDESAIDEVRRLHSFFDDWYAGRPGRTIGEFSDALDDDFSIVGPHGSVMSGAQVVAIVEQRFGVSDVAISVENFHVRRLDGVYVCRYNELQEIAGSETRRVSTAVMVAEASTPGGLAWVTVHETFTDV